PPWPAGREARRHHLDDRGHRRNALALTSEAIRRGALRRRATLQRTPRYRDDGSPGDGVLAMTGDRVGRLIRRGRRGQALAELGIIIVLLVFLVMGIIEFGRAWMIGNMITQAARHGARAAAVLPLSKRNATTHVITDSWRSSHRSRIKFRTCTREPWTLP